MAGLPTWAMSWTRPRGPCGSGWSCRTPHRKLKPEMFATIRIYSEPETNVLLVPEVSIQRERDRRFVFVQREPQVFEARDVKLGDSNGEVVKVLDGLQEGEQIVTKGSFVLKSELLGEQI